MLCADGGPIRHIKRSAQDQKTRWNDAREHASDHRVSKGPHTLEQYHGRMPHNGALVHDIAVVYGGLKTDYITSQNSFPDMRLNSLHHKKTIQSPDFLPPVYFLHRKWE